MDIAAATKTVRAPKYLVCIDGREESRTALRLACMKARARGSAVGMLHVITPADFQTLGAIADRMREERHREGEQLLQKLADEAATRYGIAPTMVLREGQTGDEILTAVLEDPDINMIVIGVAQASNTRGKLAAWLASQLGGKLLIPLMMVPGNLTDQQLESLI